MLLDAAPTSAQALALGRILDQTEDYVVARRNALIGIWAGERLGLRDEALSRYVVDVMAADLEEAGHRDILRKLTTDFGKHGISVDPIEIERRIGDAHRSAYREFLATD